METIKALAFLTAHFSKANIRAFDRGYDAGYVFDYLIPHEESFIVRMRGTRNIFHNGKEQLINKLIKRHKGTHSLHSRIRTEKKPIAKLP